MTAAFGAGSQAFGHGICWRVRSGGDDECIEGEIGNHPSIHLPPFCTSPLAHPGVCVVCVGKYPVALGYSDVVMDCQIMGQSCYAPYALGGVLYEETAG